MAPPSKRSWQVARVFNNALDVHTAGFCSVKVSCSTWKRVPRAESR